MSFSGRLLHLAVRGCLILGLLPLVLGDGRAQPSTAVPGQQTESQQADPDKAGPPPATLQPQPMPVAEQQKPDTPPYNPSCEAPKTREDADLCEQRRMSQAAIDAVWWAAFQSKLGILGFLTVLLTLFFTGRAAKAASHAAESASEQSRIAKESFEKLERPWVFIEIHPRIYRTEPKHNQDPIHTYMMYDIVNYGRVPAIIEGCWAEPAIARPFPEKPIIDLRWSGPLGPDKRLDECKKFFPSEINFEGVLVDLREETADRAIRAIPELKSDEDLCFYAIIRYRDIRGKNYESKFCWRYDCADAQWMKSGNEDYNGQT